MAMAAEAAEAAAATRAGDWQCPNTECINHSGFPTHYVYGKKVNCPKCGTGKSAQRAGDWCCPNPACVNHQNTVYGSKPACTRCGAPRPPLNARGGAVPNASPSMVGAGPLSAGPGRAGDWHCANPSCKNHVENLVFGSKTHCPLCGSEKPAPPPPMMGPAAPPPSQMGFQYPPQYQQQYAQQGGNRGPGVPQGRPGDWHCPNPECKNFERNFIFANKMACPICGSSKPENPTPASVAAPSLETYVPQTPPPPLYTPPPQVMAHAMQFGGPQPRHHPTKKGQPGDWHCVNPGCKNHTENVVYASKTACPICNTLKPAVTSLTFSANSRPGDWQCPNPSCKNHINGVYASKPVCTICGEANPNMRERSRSPH